MSHSLAPLEHETYGRAEPGVTFEGWRWHRDIQIASARYRSRVAVGDQSCGVDNRRYQPSAHENTGSRPELPATAPSALRTRRQRAEAQRLVPGIAIFIKLIASSKDRLDRGFVQRGYLFCGRGQRSAGPTSDVGMKDSAFGAVGRGALTASRWQEEGQGRMHFGSNVYRSGKGVATSQ